MSSLIQISQRYKSSTRIDSQHNDYKSFIDGFILHGTAINVLDTISRDFAGSEQRAYTLTGPYGSGKSTVALFLASSLSTNSKERAYAQKKLIKQGTIADFSSRFKVKKGWNVVKHVCGLEAPANSILVSLYHAFKVEFNFADVKALSDDECLSKIKDLVAKKDAKNDGVILLLDEMGKALDYQSRANKDLHLFQALADIAQQATMPMMLIGFLHQSFSDYAKNKDAVTQKEWGKVQGRFRDLGFNPSIEESLILVGESVTKQEAITTKLENEYQELVGNVINAFPSQNRNSEALRKTLPLDPLVSLLLGPISRRRFSQNERSLFGFLASHEKYGFREFLVKNYSSEVINELALYHPEQLWDYLHHNLHHLIVTSHDSKAWLEGCDSIHRAGQKGERLHVLITKVISLLTIFGFHHHLHAAKDFVVQYFKVRGYEESAVTQAIGELEAWTIIIYRQKHDALFVFQGSDIDINNMVLERIESISEGVDWTTACDLEQHIIATSHYHRTGTMRWANMTLVNKLDDALLGSCIQAPLTGQSFLTFLLPANNTLANELNKRELPYAAIGDIESLTTLRSVAIELIALTQIATNEAKITHDLIAKNELKNRIVVARQQVATELNLAFKQAKWTYGKESFTAKPLTTIASNIADVIFDKSPVVLNELVNRSKPSGSANSAIRKLLNAMLENGDEEDLGFDSKTFPPEKGLYLSCLKSKGWHCDTDEGYLFPSQWSDESIQENSQMHALWLDGFEFIKSSKSMVTLDDLYQRWMSPPFGMTAGLCRIYGLALLKSLEGQVAFYDFDSTKTFIFIPELDEELVNKIYKHPKEAGVRYFEISDIQTHLLDTLAKATVGHVEGSVAVLGIAKHIVKIIHTLPAWVKKTSGESFYKNGNANALTKEARDLRNKVIAANDPYKLILDDLPAIFGIDKKTKNSDEKLAACLKTAIEDLSAQHDMLLSGFKRVILSNLSAKFDEDLKARCQLIVTMAQRPNVKELASRIIRFIDGKAKFELVINLATGVPERNWTDKHLRNGLDELQNLCTQFRRIESFGLVNNKGINSKGTSQPLSFMTADRDGKHKEYSSFIKFDLSDDVEVQSMMNSVKSNLENLSKEKQLAALTNLLSSLMDKEA